MREEQHAFFVIPSQQLIITFTTDINYNKILIMTEIYKLLIIENWEIEKIAY